MLKLKTNKLLQKGQEKKNQKNKIKLEKQMYDKLVLKNEIKNK